MTTVSYRLNSLIKLWTALLILCLIAQTPCFADDHKVFIVKGRDISSYNLALQGFRSQSRQDWRIIEYNLDNGLYNIDDLAKKLRAEKPSLVVAVGTKALTALTRLQISYPAVFCMVMDPDAYDLSGFEITGVSLATSYAEQINVLTKVAPRVKRVGVLLRKRDSKSRLAQAGAVAGNYGVQIIPIELESEKDMPSKLRAVLGRVDALWMLDDAYIYNKTTLQYVVLKSLENRLPFMANHEVFVKEGALVTLSPSFFDNGKQAAEMAVQILENNKNPRSIPISLHRRPNLIINLTAARKINLDISPQILNQAKRVYK